MAKKITLNVNGSHNGYEYVDLGLPSSTMWATCNVGSIKPEDPGLLFQFGRVDGYKYGDKNNKFRTNYQNLKDGSISEYIPITTSGKVYNDNDILDPEDDAAHVHMGGKWKMPTYEQCQEMYNNTKQDVLAINNITGMLFTSKINNKKLFVPFAGYWYNGSFDDFAFIGSVWSSQVLATFNNFARIISLRHGSIATIYHNIRTCAFSVRAVFKK